VSQAEPVLLDATSEGVRVLTFNRPHQRNALSSELATAFLGALELAETDESVRVVVVTGADPAFCAGVDLKEAARFGRDYLGGSDVGRCIIRVGEMHKPIIGAINGATFTGGFELALGCDFLIASERAVFADTHARVGVLPGGGMTARLPGAVGLRKARMLSMTGDLIDAAAAERAGLVVEVVEHVRLLERVTEVARSIAEIDPQTIRSIKRMYDEGSATTMGEALRIERALSQTGALDLEQLAARRDAVMVRNRAQLKD
jgi:enoyl-CoA hydratase